MSSAPPTRATANLMHLALLLGPLLLIGVVAWLRLGPDARPMAPIHGAEVLPLITYVVGAMSYGMALVFRGRIPALAPGDDENAWWARNLSRALVVWAMAEAPMILAGIVFLLLGNLTVLAVVAGAGFLIMLLTAPARLVG